MARQTWSTMMRATARRTLIGWRAGGLAAAVLVLAASAACSSNDDAATPTSTEAGGDQPVTVNVTMMDFGIQSSMSEFEAGVPYHFVVKNEGQVPHEFMIMQPMQPGMMAMSEMDRLAVGYIEEDDLGPGMMAEMDLTFDKPYSAGELEFVCHITGHYEAGMHSPITVQ